MQLSRRDFIRLLAATTSVSTLSLPLLADGFKRWPHLKNSLVINGLGGIGNPNIHSSNVLEYVNDRALNELAPSGLTAVNLTLGYVAGPHDPYEYSIGSIRQHDRIMGAHSDKITLIKTQGDIIDAKRRNKVGIIYGFQNAVQLEHDPMASAKSFHDAGVRIIQLTYNIQNKCASGCMVPDDTGVTELGHQVIDAINDNNILLDLSHSGERTCLEALRYTKTIPTISHTGCRALSDLPRNKTDEELRLLANKGGVVGIYFMPFLLPDRQPKASHVIRHIEHAINICGEDHVSFGSDGSVSQIDDLVAYKVELKKEIIERRRLGISASGETFDIFPFIEDLRGVDQFQKLADMLHSRGHGDARIEKVLGKNLLRLYGDVWG